MPMEFRPLALPGLLLAVPKVYGDERGSFFESYRREEFEAAGIRGAFVQWNQSRTARKGLVRGLHFQRAPHAQGKLVRCLRGRIFDVAVDLRRGTPTFGKAHAQELSAERGEALWVPAGFAHGFQALEDGCEVLYGVDAPYAPASEAGLRWDDPALGIAWPLPGSANARDAGWPGLSGI